MAILWECSACHTRNPEKAPLCGKCGQELRSKGRVYWIDYYLPCSRRRRERIGPWKKLAEEVLAKKKAEIAENKFLDKVKMPKIIFKDFAKEYLEWCRINNKHPQTKEHRVKLLNDHFGEKLLTDISPLDVEKYKMLRKQKVKTETVNKELTILRHMLNKAKEWGLLFKENPCTSVKWFKKAPGRLRFLDREEITRLLYSCEGYLKDMVQIALNTGMRKGEILNLRTEDVDINFSLIHVRDSKTGQGRDIPINSNLLVICERLKKDAKGEYIFENTETGKPFDDVKKSFHSALKKAEINGATFHTLRHTFASHLVMEGVDLPTVASLLGHRDISMTMRYAHLTPDHRKIAVEKLCDLTSDDGKAWTLIWPPKTPAEQTGASKSMKSLASDPGLEPGTSGSGGQRSIHLS